MEDMYKRQVQARKTFFFTEEKMRHREISLVIREIENLIHNIILFFMLIEILRSGNFPYKLYLKVNQIIVRGNFPLEKYPS